MFEIRTLLKGTQGNMNSKHCLRTLNRFEDQNDTKQLLITHKWVTKAIVHVENGAGMQIPSFTLILLCFKPCMYSVDERTSSER